LLLVWRELHPQEATNGAVLFEVWLMNVAGFVGTICDTTRPW
jgi:hypothetical protein